MKGHFGRYALIGAFVCALLAAWTNWKIVEGREQKLKVLVVTQEIQPFVPIPKEALRVEERPATSVPSDAISDLKLLENRYSRALLVVGDVVREPHLVPASGNHLAAKLSAEGAYSKRAMAIQVNPSTSVAGTLREGDPVDVLVAIQHSGAEQEGNRSGTLAKIIAQRVPVLLVQKAQSQGLTSNGQMTVVLEVEPQVAEEIAFAQAQGMIWLITGPYHLPEGKKAQTTGVDLKSFLDKHQVGAASGGKQP